MKRAADARRLPPRRAPEVRVISPDRDDPVAVDELYRILGELLDRELRRVG